MTDGSQSREGFIYPERSYLCMRCFYHGKVNWVSLMYQMSAVVAIPSFNWANCLLGLNTLKCCWAEGPRKF